jgi:uncharacterized membrane protein SpoIIM required for sporulation
VTFIVALFGFCGVHKESVWLLLTYILLIVITIVFQVIAMVIIARRENEMRTVHSHVTRVSLEGKDLTPPLLNSWEKMMFLTVTTSLSSLFFLLSLWLIYILHTNKERLSGSNDQLFPV